MILVTGCHGFLGMAVKTAFKAANTPILAPMSKELDMTSKSSVMDYIEHHRPDKVLHMAALCGGIKANSKSPADFLHVNLKMATNLFDAVNKYNIKYVYGLGTVCMYPLHCQTPFKEDDLWKDFPEPTNAPYGLAKKMLMLLQQTYRQQYGLKGAHFIPVNMYGPNDHFDLENSHVIPALIRKFSEAVTNNQPKVYCWGTGEAYREFLFVEDCASALVKATISGFDSHFPINLGTGHTISIKNLAGLIGQLTGFTGEIVFTGEVSDGQPRRQLDVSRAKELLGFEAKTTLLAGLAKTIGWYEKNKENYGE